MEKNTLYTTSDGSHSLVSGAFGVSYHSKHGAIQESDHVFIECGLRYKAKSSKQLSILEIGLGTGLNVFMTLLEAQKHSIGIEYVALEKFPLSESEFSMLNYSSVLLANDSQLAFEEIHQCAWDKKVIIIPNFEFKKLQLDATVLEFKEQFDVIYFDAFAPENQPELWSTCVFERMFDALKANGVLVTYCAKGQVRRDLQEAGFKTERLPGPPGKREMLRATKLASKV